MGLVRKYTSALCNRLLRVGDWNPDRSMRLIALQAKWFSVLPIRAKVKAGGSVQHYYHFLFDLLMPLDTLLARHQGNYRLALPDCGPFNQICKDLYGDRVVTWDETDQYRMSVRANLQGMEPLTFDLDHEAMWSFRERMMARQNIVHGDGNPLVLVIERTAPIQFYQSEQSVTKSAGAQRRSIMNHDELFQRIKTVFNTNVEILNLKLEQMSFGEQLKLFSQARIVIGQHGAGLSNQIWMQTGGVVVEIRIDDHRNHFKRLAKTCRHLYTPFHVDSDYPEIDLDEFERSVRQNEYLVSYLTQ